jgi:TetR/AcrR family transcriptional regulator, tetracycline repressor protein
MEQDARNAAPNMSLVPTRASSTRARLDRAQVVETALAIADTQGLDALTVRKLAQELGVTPMALYWHFEDKDALLAAIADGLWDETVALLEASGSAGLPSGAETIRSTMNALVQVLDRHPRVAGLAATRALECTSGLEITERALAALGDMGVVGRDAAYVAHFLLLSAVMLVSERPGTDPTDQRHSPDELRRKEAMLSSLPPDRFPHLIAGAGDLIRCDDVDDYFSQGLDLIMAGVEARSANVSRP